MKPGERVGAIQQANDEEVHLFGYGTYDGDFEPPSMFGIPKEEILEEWKKHGISNTNLPLNPRITLDDGSVVWGNECWWGPEDKTKEFIGNRKVIMVEKNEA